MGMERRNSPRRMTAARDSVAWLCSRGRSVPLYVQNESEGGVGVALVGLPPVEVGESVTVEWLRKEVTALVGTVRHVKRLDADTWSLGLEWRR